MTTPTAPLVAPASWLVWRRADPLIRVRVTSQTAYGAWLAACATLGNPSFGECECSLEENPS